MNILSFYTIQKYNNVSSSLKNKQTYIKQSQVLYKNILIHIWFNVNMMPRPPIFFYVAFSVTSHE